MSGAAYPQSACVGCTRVATQALHKLRGQLSTTHFAIPVSSTSPLLKVRLRSSTLELTGTKAMLSNEEMLSATQHVG